MVFARSRVFAIAKTKSKAYAIVRAEVVVGESTNECGALVFEAGSE